MIKLMTINVVKMWQGEIMELVSYPDTPEGKQNAETCFRNFAKGIAECSEEEMEDALEHGIFEHGLHSATIVHSTI